MQVQEEHERKLGGVQLPADEDSLQRSHESAVLQALARFDAEKFGNMGQAGAGPLRESLNVALTKQLEYELMPCCLLPPLPPPPPPPSFLLYAHFIFCPFLHALKALVHAPGRQHEGALAPNNPPPPLPPLARDMDASTLSPLLSPLSSALLPDFCMQMLSPCVGRVHARVRHVC